MNINSFSIVISIHVFVLIILSLSLSNSSIDTAQGVLYSGPNATQTSSFNTSNILSPNLGIESAINKTESNIQQAQHQLRENNITGINFTLSSLNDNILSLNNLIHTTLLKKDTGVNKSSGGPYKYDFAISYSGDQYPKAQKLYNLLKNESRVFFYVANDTLPQMIGVDLSKALRNIYGPDSRYVISLISDRYLSTDYTNFEFNVAQAEQMKRNDTHVLPLRLDNTIIPGIKSTVAYLDGTKMSLEEISKILLNKLKSDQQKP
jgi:hypothetical protein